MAKLIESLIPVAVSVVVGLVITHPLTWRAELAKRQYSILKEITRTNNWGSPLLWKTVTKRPNKMALTDCPFYGTLKK